MCDQFNDALTLIDNWSEIAMYCKGKITMFQEKFGLKLENGMPTDDTFQRIFAVICDYVICLKGNHETLHEDVRLYF